MATMYDYPETPLTTNTRSSRAEEDKALEHVVNIGARNDATVEEIRSVIEILGLTDALDRVRKDIEIP